MANSIFASKALVGGGAGSLDDISHSALTDGDVVIVIIPASKYLYFYTWDEDEATAANDSPDLIKPVSVGVGVGSWLLSYQQSFDEFFRASAAATDLDEFYTGLGIKYDHTWIGAGAWNPNETAPPIFLGEEYTTNDVNVAYYAFDGTAKEIIEFDLDMPPTWDRSTIKAKFTWTPASGASVGDEVRWGIEGYAYSDGDEMDQAMGTEQEVTDTVLAGEDEAKHKSAATSACTLGGTPASGDMIHLRVYRDPTHGDDDMTEDAHLLGVTIEFANTNQVTAW